jgi:hypothetical protein
MLVHSAASLSERLLCGFDPNQALVRHPHYRGFTLARLMQQTFGGVDLMDRTRRDWSLFPSRYAARVHLPAHVVTEALDHLMGHLGIC